MKRYRGNEKVEFFPLVKSRQVNGTRHCRQVETFFEGLKKQEFKYCGNHYIQRVLFRVQTKISRQFRRIWGEFDCINGMFGIVERSQFCLWTLFSFFFATMRVFRVFSFLQAGPSPFGRYRVKLGPCEGGAGRVLRSRARTYIRWTSSTEDVSKLTSDSCSALRKSSKCTFPSQEVVYDGTHFWGDMSG